MTRAAIVAAARLWIGTPFVHGAALQGVGCDCLGLVLGLREALGLPALPPPPPYPPGWGLRGQGEALLAGLVGHLPPASGPPAPGQVLLFRLRPGAPAGHLGIQTVAGAGAAFVHAYDRHGVVESPLPAPWARRIVARFELA